MSKLFTFINSLNDKKRMDPEDSEYLPFMVNRGMSFFKDTILSAAEMNLYPDLSKQQHYDYYFHKITKKKRFSKWFKREKDKDIDNIIEYFGYSYQKAQDAMKILTPTQLKEISKSLEKGG